MKVLVIGSAVVDIAVQGVPPHDSWNEKQRIERISMTLGGDALNQAVRLAQIGEKTVLVAKTGDDSNGHFLRSELKEIGVDCSFVAESKELPTGTALVLVGENGERNVFSVNSAHATLTADDCFPALTDDIKALSIASLFSLPVLEENGMVELLDRAKSMNITTFADLANDKLNKGFDGIKDFLPYIDYFIPSLYDAERMTGLTDVAEIASFYRSNGANGVIIKLGADGVYASTDEFTGYISAPKVKPIDTTGAGDTFVAYFISNMMNGMGVEQSCKMACIAATASTLSLGASSVPVDLSLI